MRARRRRRSRALLPACSGHQVDLAGPVERLRPGRLGGRPEGVRQEELGVGPPVLPGARRRLPSERARPDARLALADSYFKEGGHGQLHPRGLRLSRVPDPLPVSSQERLRAVPGGRVFFLQKNGPDRDQTNTRRPSTSSSASSSLPALAPTPSRPAAHPRLPAEPRQGGIPGRLLLSADAKGLALRDRRYEGLITDYPDYERLDEVLYRLSQCLIISARKAEARHSSTASSRNTRRARWPTRPRSSRATFPPHGRHRGRLPCSRPGRIRQGKPATPPRAPRLRRRA